MSKRINASYRLICEEIGNWWNDDRKKWCAYCGIPMKLRCSKGEPVPPQKKTRDHLLSRKLNGSDLTIPCCCACNQAKAAMSLPEFMASAYFRDKRKLKHRNKWSNEQLWAALGMAALKRSLELKTTRPQADLNKE